MDDRPRRRRSIARAAVVATVAGLASASVVLFLGGRIINCWMGIGPAPEPQTSQCVARTLGAMAPWERFQFDHPVLAPVVAGFVTFVLAMALLLALGAAVRRARAR
jgi:hypothetical protein